IHVDYKHTTKEDLPKNFMILLISSLSQASACLMFVASAVTLQLNPNAPLPSSVRHLPIHNQ
ncbi:MAG: hypothetical protein ACRDDA_10160, partial [Aeromonas sp.]